MNDQGKGGNLPSIWIAELDGLRAIAALSVVLAHFNPAPLVPSHRSFFALIQGINSLPLANLGVTFFYTLSSFLLTYLGVREHDSSRSVDITRFYLRRVFRIWPLYFSILTVNLVMAAVWSPAAQWAWIRRDIWMFVGFLSNWSLALNYVGRHVDRSTPPLAIMWSIGVEEQFYFFFPLLLYLALRFQRNLRIIAVSLVVVGVISRLAFLFVPVTNRAMASTGGMYYATLTYADVFLAGAAAGWLAARGVTRSLFWFSILRNRAMGLCILAAIILLAMAWRNQLWYPYASYSPVLYGVTGGFLALGVLWIVVHHDSVVSHLLRSAPLRALGTLSYGIYLWHPISGFFVSYDLSPLMPKMQEGVDVTALAFFLMYMAVTITAATLTYAFIERPFLVVKNRFYRRDRSGSGRPLEAANWVVHLIYAGVVVVILVEAGLHFVLATTTRTRLASLLQ